MKQGAEFCLHPQDLEGCQGALIQAWQQQRLERHCVIDGLRTSWQQTRAVLVGGLIATPAATPPAVAAVKFRFVQAGDLKVASEAAVLLGLQKNLASARDVFVDAYYKLIHYAIHKFQITDDGQPSAEDVRHDVLLDLLSHFRKEVDVQPGCLRAYVWQAAVRKCLRVLKSDRPLARLSENESATEQEAETYHRENSSQSPATEMVETWEERDAQLHASKQGDIINRLIMAHQFIDRAQGSKMPSLKEVMSYWQRLAAMPEARITELHNLVSAEVRRFPWLGIVLLSWDLISRGLAQAWELPVIFAAGTGLDFNATKKLVAQVNSLAAGSVYARISRMYQVFGGQKSKRGKIPSGIEASEARE